MAYTTVSSLFSAICDAIRAKKDSADPIAHQDIPDQILSIQSGDIEQELYTDDGKSRMVVDVPAGTFTFKGNTGYNRNLTIDWGDGTTSDTGSGSFSGTFEHEYAAAGKYLIVIESTDGVTTSKWAPTLKWGSDKPYTKGRNAIIGVCFGRNTYFTSNITVQDRIDLKTLVIYQEDMSSAYSNCKANNCKALRHAKFSQTSTTSGQTITMQFCESLDSVVIPSVPTISANTFNSCYSLGIEELPSGITTIQADSFASCYQIKRIFLPETLTTLARAFNYCENLSCVVMTGETTIPSLDSNGWNITPISASTGYIYVKDDLVDQYKAATNWSAYAARILGWSELPEDAKAILRKRGHTV